MLFALKKSSRQVAVAWFIVFNFAQGYRELAAIAQERDITVPWYILPVIGLSLAVGLLLWARGGDFRFRVDEAHASHPPYSTPGGGYFEVSVTWTTEVTQKLQLFDALLMITQQTVLHPIRVAPPIPKVIDVNKESCVATFHVHDSQFLKARASDGRYVARLRVKVAGKDRESDAFELHILPAS